VQLLPLLGKVKRFSYVFTVNDMQKSWYWERELAGGGSWLNMGWHAMPVLNWMFGTPKEVVVAWNIGGQRTWQYDTEHSALAKLRYRQGITGTVFVSCIYPKEETLKVHGEQGQLSCRRDELTFTLPTGKVTAVTSASSEDAYINQYKDVFERLNTRAYPFQRDLDVLRPILNGYDNVFETSLEEMKAQGALYESAT
jgi:predicted dehydrogenase